MSDSPDTSDAIAPTADPEIEAAIKSLPPEFYDQPEDLRAIDLAMIHSKGNVTAAAQVLEMELKELKTKVRRSKYLRARWVKEPVRVTKAVPPPAPPVHVPTAAELTENLDAATAAYEEQLRTITNDDNQANLGSRLFRLQMGHSIHGMALLGGGMQRAAMQLITLIDHLRTHPYPDEYTPDGVLVRSGQRETDQMILRAQQEYGRRSTEYAQITMMTAKTQQIMALNNAGKNGNAKPSRKPGFSPMRPLSTQVLAQPGSTVVLQQGGTDDGEKTT